MADSAVMPPPAARRGVPRCAARESRPSRVPAHVVLGAELRYRSGVGAAEPRDRSECRGAVVRRYGAAEHARAAESTWTSGERRSPSGNGMAADPTMGRHAPAHVGRDPHERRWRHAARGRPRSCDPRSSLITSQATCGSNAPVSGCTVCHPHGERGVTPVVVALGSQ